MNLEDLKAYLSQKYQGGKSFLENIIFFYWPKDNITSYIHIIYQKTNLYKMYFNFNWH